MESLEYLKEKYYLVSKQADMRKLLGRWLRERAIKRRISEEAQLPPVSLPHEYMKHLIALPNRIALLKQLPKNGVVAEIGVAEGDFAASIHSINAPEKLYLIDQWSTVRYSTTMKKTVEQRFSNELANGDVELLHRQSLEAATLFSEAYFDWIYIDTDHSYEMTKRELQAYAPKVKSRGIIAGHDFVQGNWVQGIRYGVIEAVYEFCIAHHWELIYLTLDFQESLSFGLRKVV